MKRNFLLIILMVSIKAYAAPEISVSTKTQPAHKSVAKAIAPKPVSFNFQLISVAQVVQLIYSESLNTPYVLDPEVLTDTRFVSFRYDNGKGDLKVFLRTFLESLGFTLHTRDGVDYVAKSKATDKLEVEQDILIYRPKYRKVSYLARLLSPAFKGSFAVNRSIATNDASKVQKNVPDGSAASLIDQDADTLVFTGSKAEVVKLRKLLVEVDFAVGEILVRGAVYEVTTTHNDGSAFNLALNILRGKFNVGIGTSITPTGNYLQFKNNSIDAIFSALSSDSRFKVISSPSLRIRSGSSGKFAVGQEVPVLGALSYPQGSGQAVQSVEYRSSGVLFNLQPNVRDAVVDLSISQQLSNFVNTTTGVNNSPTLIKRSVETAVTMGDGDVIVLGGLMENKESYSSDGLSFLPSFLQTKHSDHSRSEIVVILQMNRI